MSEWEMPADISGAITGAVLGCTNRIDVSDITWRVAKALHDAGLLNIPAERDAQEHELKLLREAVGLISTLKPDMVIDALNPLGIARQVKAHVQAERDAQEKRVRELEADIKALSIAATTLSEWVDAMQGGVDA